MNSRVSVVALFSLAVLALGACSSNTPGTPGPATSGTTTQSNTGGSSPSTDASDPLASTDPCTLLDPTVISQNQLVPDKSGTGPGTRYCRWNKVPNPGSVGYNVAINIYDNAGLDQLGTAGFTISNHPVGQHQGRLSKDTAGEACAVSVEVTKTSRVDIVGVDGGANVDTSCTIATLIAPSVEQKLPAGGS